MHFLLPLSISLGVAYILSEFLRKIGIPRVVGQILTGMFLGIPVIRTQLFGGDVLDVFSDLSDIAIILLFFFIGFGFNARALQGVRLRESATVSLFSTFIPFSIGLALAFALGADILIGAILGISFAVSSQIVTFNLLEELKLLKTRVGGITMAAGAIDDIIEFVLVSIVIASIQLAYSSIYSVFINVLAFIGIISVMKFAILPWVLRSLEKQKSQRGLFVGAMIITTMMAFLSEFLGLSSLIGALAAGVIVGQVLRTNGIQRPEEENALAKTLDTVSFGFFVPLFFVYMGLNFNFNIASIMLGILLSGFAIIGTTAGSAIGMLLSGRSFKEAIIAGLGVTPKGDVDIVIASLALSNGIIGQELFSGILFMALLTTFVGPLLFRYFATKWHSELVKG